MKKIDDQIDDWPLDPGYDRNILCGKCGESIHVFAFEDYGEISLRTLRRLVHQHMNGERHNHPCKSCGGALLGGKHEPWCVEVD